MVLFDGSEEASKGYSEHFLGPRDDAFPLQTPLSLVLLSPTEFLPFTMLDLLPGSLTSLLLQLVVLGLLALRLCIFLFA